MLAMAFAGAYSARAADVEIIADTPAVNLDSETGSTSISPAA
jgi:hypothetical protein